MNKKDEKYENENRRRKSGEDETRPINNKQEEKKELNQLKVTDEPSFGVAYDFNNFPKIVAVHTLDREDERSKRKCTTVEIFTQKIFEKTFIDNKQQIFLRNYRDHYRSRYDHNDYIYNDHDYGDHVDDYRDYNYRDYDDFDCGYNNYDDRDYNGRDYDYRDDDHHYNDYDDTDAKKRSESLEKSAGSSKRTKSSFTELNHKIVYDKRRITEPRLKSKRMNYKKYHAKDFAPDKNVIFDDSRRLLCEKHIDDESPTFVDLNQSWKCKTK